MTVRELIEAYKTGAISDPIQLDNDTVDAYADDANVFTMAPERLLQALLDHVGVPWEMV